MWLLIACQGVTPTPPARLGAVGGVVSGRLWTMGGVGDGQLLPEVWSYTLETSDWVRHPDAPAPFAFGTAQWDGESFLVVGGRGPDGVTGRVWRFDPEVQSWTDLLPVPHARERFGAATLGEAVYLTGGVDGQGIPLPDAWRYAAGRWELVSGDLGYGSIYGHMLLAGEDGGAWQTAGFGVFADALYAFDGTTMSYVSPGPGAREGACGLVDGSIVWVTGGSETDLYADAYSGTWSESSEEGPEPRQYALCASISETLYVLGGRAFDDGAALLDLWRLRDGDWKNVLDGEGRRVEDP